MLTVVIFLHTILAELSIHLLDFGCVEDDTIMGDGFSEEVTIEDEKVSCPLEA